MQSLGLVLLTTCSDAWLLFRRSVVLSCSSHSLFDRDMGELRTTVGESQAQKSPYEAFPLCHCYTRCGRYQWATTGLGFMLDRI